MSPVFEKRTLLSGFGFIFGKSNPNKKINDITFEIKTFHFQRLSLGR